MSTFQTKIRGHQPPKKFADSAKAARAANTRSGGGGPVEGKYERLILTEKPIWLRLSPEQSYAQQLYDKNLKKVIETGLADAEGNVEWPARPWFEYKSHFVVVTERPHTCSSGPFRDAACRGCANRSYFYDMQRSQEKKTQVRDEKARKHPPVQESVRYAMGVTCLEKIFEMDVLDKKGKPRTNKAGEPITNFVPAPNTGWNPQKIRETDGVFGHNFHWPFGPVHLGNLSSIDTTLWNSCASCANALMATQFGCPNCEGIMYEDETGITGTDLRTMRETVLKCPHCAFEGCGQPVLLCTGCDNAVEGSILAFDLRLRLDYPDPTDDKKSTVVLEEFRLPDYEKLFPKDAERIFEMLYSPLDVVKIFAPEDIGSQAYAYPEDLKKIDPSYHVEASKKRKDSAPYGSGDGGEEGGDPDKMSFGNNNG